METIERRARKYTERVSEPYKHCVASTFFIIWNLIYYAFLNGAKDQNQRIINKACGWLKSRKILTDVNLEEFRKVMKN